MNSLLFSLAARNLLRNRRRTILNLFAVTFAVWSALLLASFARGVSGQMRDRGIQEIPGHIKVSDRNYRVDPSVFSSIGSLPFALTKRLSQGDISTSFQRIRVPGVLKSERRSRGVYLIGTDFDQERRVTFLKDAKVEIQEGQRGLIVGSALLDRLQTQIGRKVVLFAETSEGRADEMGIRIVGTFSTGVEGTELGYAYLDRATLQKFLKLGDRISEISIFLKDPAQSEQVQSELQKILPDLDVATWKEVQPMLDSMARVQQGFLSIFFLFVVVVIAFGLANTFFMSVSERMRELALIRALGMKGRQVVRLIVSEGTVLLFVGVALGNLLLWISIRALGGKLSLTHFARGFEMFHMNSDVYFIVRTHDLILLNALIAVIGIAACIWPAFRAAKSEIRRVLG